MSITTQEEFNGMQRVSQVVAITLKKMREKATPGMSTHALDLYGAKILESYGAKSAPYLTYKFPGYTCISVNHEIAHGIPSKNRILKEGDLVNIDVSAELKGFWSDNGGSFVLGEDKHGYSALVNASKEILRSAIASIKGGVKISAIGHIIETQASEKGFTVIRNLAGHGVGRSLHEEPSEILNCRNRFNRKKFKTNSVVAIETFIATKSSMAKELSDGWTLVGNKGGHVAQHEHTIMITDNEPIIFTSDNDIWS